MDEGEDNTIIGSLEQTISSKIKFEIIPSIAICKVVNLNMFDIHTDAHRNILEFIELFEYCSCSLMLYSIQESNYISSFQ